MICILDMGEYTCNGLAIYSCNNISKILIFLSFGIACTAIVYIYVLPMNTLYISDI